MLCVCRYVDLRWHLAIHEMMSMTLRLCGISDIWLYIHASGRRTGRSQ